ncbi:hypothetical protein Shyhy01_26540 [Streptomyces hygroscopicus subsp. hygroscopicus]|nr:replication-relaxation family protein [Streptomyces hygroscopicus]GLX49704.1 hypothetical protein Shyhy01_26540 [Streptomyces hygroscopicus subsp. hygroscopicus]
MRISALRKLRLDAKGRPVKDDGYDEHAAAVTSTAAVLTGAGYGIPLSWQTEIAHKLPYGYTQYADLTMRAPDTGVPAMLLEVDRVTEPVDELVAKLRRYHDWFKLLAPNAYANKEKAASAARCGGARIPPVVAGLSGDGPRGVRAGGVRVHRPDGRPARQPDRAPGAGRPRLLRQHPAPVGSGHGRRLPPGGACGRHRAGADHRRPAGAELAKGSAHTSELRFMAYDTTPCPALCRGHSNGFLAHRGGPRCLRAVPRGPGAEDEDGTFCTAHQRGPSLRPYCGGGTLGL